MAKARLASIVDAVLERGDRYVIERNGRAVAALVSIAELERLGGDSGKPNGPAGALALVGLWHDVQDEVVDALVANARTARDRDKPRSVELDA